MRRAGLCLALSVAACASTRPPRAIQAPAPLFPTATAILQVVFVYQTPTPEPTMTPAAADPPAPAICAGWLTVCWNVADQAKVAHICYEEARGLLTPGMASCASTVAVRQSQPQWFGGPDLDTLLRWDQFRVQAAVTRPWAQGVPAPAEALAAVAAFLAGERGAGCWGYDNFRGLSPDAASAYVAEAPERRCAVIRGGQAMAFFNWRNP